MSRMDTIRSSKARIGATCTTLPKPRRAACQPRSSCKAIAKMRAALVTTYTCRACGTSDGSHRQSRSGDSQGYCASCWRESVAASDRRASAPGRRHTEERGDHVVLDSETSGLSPARDEVLEHAIIHSSGAVLFSSLIQPENPQRPDLATHIHGITGEMLASAPHFPAVWPVIAAILRRFRRVLVYNAAFDYRLLRQRLPATGYVSLAACGSVSWSSTPCFTVRGVPLTAPTPGNRWMSPALTFASRRKARPTGNRRRALR